MQYRLYKEALRVQRFLETEGRTLDPLLQKFPASGCDGAANILATWLTENGEPGIEVVRGYRSGTEHTWVEQSGVVIDIARHRVAVPIYVGFADTFCASFEKRRSGHPEVSERLRPVYEAMKRRLEHEPGLSDAGLVGLSEHCALLSSLIMELSSVHEISLHDSKEGHTTWGDASEWLYLAASVRAVDVDTTRFDHSIYMCKRAWEYESERSELLADLTFELVVFNFVWGAFETAAHLLDLPRIPRSLTRDQTSIVDRAAYCLQQRLSRADIPRGYNDTLSALKKLLQHAPQYVERDLVLPPHISESGVGVHVVRKIRNRFAHGSATLPSASWPTQSFPADVGIVRLSARLVLLTVQMLLLARFHGQVFGVEIDNSPKDVSVVLHTLHLKED